MEDMNVNAKELARMMREGAKLQSKWKSRTYQKPKMLYILSYPDGSSINIQYSLVEACLKAKTIRVSSVWEGGRCEYEAINA